MKKLAKRILIILVAVIVAVQASFIYRRYKIGQLEKKIAELNAQLDTNVQGSPVYLNGPREYKGIIHAHTNLGGHSAGSFDELITAANSNGLDFVLMTEHWSDAYDTAGLTLNGVFGNTLFVGGNEIDTADSDRFLMIPGSADAAGFRTSSTDAVLEKLHAENRLAYVTYPEKFKSWDADFDGIEVFSLHTNAKRMNPFTAVFDAIWSFSSYPGLMLATHFKRPDENLSRFDEITSRRRIGLIAGTDAHSNIGVHLFGDDAGNRAISLKIDRYDLIFRLARQHVLLPADKPLDRENLLAALKSGNSFVAFDVLGDSTGFRFGNRILAEPIEMGAELPLDQAAATQLFASAPIPGRFIVFRNGSEFYRGGPASEISFRPDQPGAYRVEVYLDQLGPPFDKMPWIMSNPIFVR